MKWYPYGTCIDAFVNIYSGPLGPALDFPGGAAIGVSRHVVVGETVEDAMRVSAASREVRSDRRCLR